MTDQQKVREAFEAYWSELSWNVERIDNPSGYVEYKNHDLHHIWMGWQASLAHASSASAEECSEVDHIAGGGKLVGEDARDAARYRWLRERNEGCQGDMLPWVCRGTVTTGLSHWNKDALDQAIDQAIAGRRGDGNG